MSFVACFCWKWCWKLSCPKFGILTVIKKHWFNEVKCDFVSSLMLRFDIYKLADDCFTCSLLVGEEKGVDCMFDPEMKLSGCHYKWRATADAYDWIIKCTSIICNGDYFSSCSSLGHLLWSVLFVLFLFIVMVNVIRHQNVDF